MLLYMTSVYLVENDGTHIHCRSDDNNTGDTKGRATGLSDLVAYVIRVSDHIVNIKTYLWSL